MFLIWGDRLAASPFI